MLKTPYLHMEFCELTRKNSIGIFLLFSAEYVEELAIEEATTGALGNNVVLGASLEDILLLHPLVNLFAGTIKLAIRQAQINVPTTLHTRRDRGLFLNKMRKLKCRLNQQLLNKDNCTRTYSIYKLTLRTTHTQMQSRIPLTMEPIII